jgi:hypothetical protein
MNAIVVAPSHLEGRLPVAGSVHLVLAEDLAAAEHELIRGRGP